MGLNPYLFIVGCPRSGTTLLRRMVDAHPQIAITRETHWIPELAPADGRATAALCAALAEHPKFATLGIEREELETLAGGSYAAFVEAVFDRYGAGQGKPFVGDKTPGYVREMPLLHELVPGARFVHLVRDGRDVCLSALGWERKAEQFRQRFPTWVEAPVGTAALWWRWHVLQGRRSGRELGASLYHELRYEDLVADPERACRRLCAFLGVEFDAAMLRFHEGRTRHDPRLSAKRAWLPPTPGLRDWRSQMPRVQLEQFEAAAGDALDELGYERVVAAPAPAPVGPAAALAAFPGVPLPEGWAAP
jgi:sulfotransferase family protein